MTLNSPNEIHQGVSDGKVAWAGLLAVLAARSVLAVLCQLLVSVIFFRDSADAFREAGQWWRVYGTVIDIGCIILLGRLTRREGIRLLDLGGYRRDRWVRDVLLGMGLFVPVFALTMVLPETVISRVIYGGPAPVTVGRLPVFATVYALVIWPVIWAFAEDNAYFGYSLPRLEALTGRKSLAVVTLVAFATLQHGFLPRGPDWQHFVYRCATSAPVIIIFSLLYLRQRRLLPLHMIHWAGNVLGIVMLMIMPVAGRN